MHQKVPRPCTLLQTILALKLMADLDNNLIVTDNLRSHDQDKPRICRESVQGWPAGPPLDASCAIHAPAGAAAEWPADANSDDADGGFSCGRTCAGQHDSCYRHSRQWGVAVIDRLHCRSCLNPDQYLTCCHGNPGFLVSSKIDLHQERARPASSFDAPRAALQLEQRTFSPGQPVLPDAMQNIWHKIPKKRKPSWAVFLKASTRVRNSLQNSCGHVQREHVTSM